LLVKKKYLFILLILLGNFTNGQRQFAVNDSTSYSFQGIDITVGRNKVYRNQNNSLTLVRDFSINNPQIPEDYIRDFDFIDANTWYVLVGSRYIGNESELYKTSDGGINWQLIAPESFSVPVFLNGRANHINQIQVLNNKIYLFDAYYESRVFYSDNNGQTWTLWFQNQIAHFYQILPCGSNLYIYGLAGDGFPSSMTKIPDEVFGQTNTTFYDGCHNISVGCYYASATTIPEICNYYNNLITSICALNNQENALSNIKLNPNPTSNTVFIDGFDVSIPFDVSVFNALGQLCLRKMNEQRIDVSSLSNGLYFLKISQEYQTKTIPFLKK
jgi:hypothetical protein